ncbi:flavodoxin [Thomasclavelia sp.]
MKKRIFSLILGVFMVMGLSACGNTQQQDSSETAVSKQTGDGKSLIVYFSMPETTNPDNMNAEEEYSTVVIDGEVLGNTQYVAYVIQENTGADIFRIEPITPYPMNHEELEEVATKEKRNNAMPEIAAQVENIEQYETIFIGYPNWYADMPRIIYNFLEQYDLSGKTIIPFVTSGGSGFSNTISTIADLEPDANVETDGFSISRTAVQDAEQEIIQWVNDLGYAK